MLFKSLIVANNSSVVVDSGSSTAIDSIPTFLHVFLFIRTYVSEAGSLPTRIVARVGFIPFDTSSETSVLISSSLREANFLPSKIFADIELLSHL